MARPAKKQAAQKFEEPEEAEGWEDAVVEADGKDGEADLRLRDWRDVERFREMKDLRRLVDDDYGLEEIFHIHLKPRIEVPPRQPKTVSLSKAAAAKAALAKAAQAKAAPPKAAPAKAVPAAAKPAPKPALKAVAKAAARHHAPAKKAKAPAKAHKVKAKAKRK